MRLSLKKYIQDLKSKNLRVRLIAVEALGKIKDPKAVPALSEALKDKNLDVRKKAVDALGEITGQTIDDEILDSIFSQFCLGK